jgi:hypothetical protein
LRALAQVRDARERARQQNQIVMGDTIRQRLLLMTTDFKKLWNDPTTPNREENGYSPTSSRMPHSSNCRWKESRKFTSGLKEARPKR